MSDIDKIKKIAKERKELKKQTFKFIIDMCYNKITTLANKGYQWCFFEIPFSVFGYPKYSLDECSDYLINKLTDIGYKVELYKNNNNVNNKIITNYILLISWF